MKQVPFLLSVLFLSVTLMFLSCSSSPKHPAELAAADSLKKVIRTTDSVFRRIDSLAVNSTLHQITYCLAYIQLNQKDTIDKADGRTLLNFYQLKRPLSVFSKHRKEIEHKLAEQKLQCENLVHDLTHNTLDPKLDLSACLQNERRRVASIAGSTSFLTDAVSDALKKFKEQYPNLEGRMNTLKAKGGKEPQGLDKQSDADEDRD
jgi:hypothetical protein